MQRIPFLIFSASYSLSFESLLLYNGGSFFFNPKQRNDNQEGFATLFTEKW